MECGREEQFKSLGAMLLYLEGDEDLLMGC
jgi:hypothetical protein